MVYFDLIKRARQVGISSVSKKEGIRQINNRKNGNKQIIIRYREFTFAQKLLILALVEADNQSR